VPCSLLGGLPGDSAVLRRVGVASRPGSAAILFVGDSGSTGRRARPRPAECEELTGERREPNGLRDGEALCF